MSTLQRAIEIATQAHQGQFDKSGKDYIGHPLRVMEMGRTEEEKIAGVLHDVVEDSEWTFEALETEGFSQEIIAALKCVTKLSENENYDDFIERVRRNPLAVAVKLNSADKFKIAFVSFFVGKCNDICTEFVVHFYSTPLL